MQYQRHVMGVTLKVVICGEYLPVSAHGHGAKQELAAL
jgi:hypothetical protein